MPIDHNEQDGSLSIILHRNLLSEEDYEKIVVLPRQINFLYLTYIKDAPYSQKLIDLLSEFKTNKFILQSNDESSIIIFQSLIRNTKELRYVNTDGNIKIILEYIKKINDIQSLYLVVCANEDFDKTIIEFLRISELKKFMIQLDITKLFNSIDMQEKIGVMIENIYEAIKNGVCITLEICDWQEGCYMGRMTGGRGTKILLNNSIWISQANNISLTQHEELGKNSPYKNLGYIMEGVCNMLARPYWSKPGDPILH